MSAEILAAVGQVIKEIRAELSERLTGQSTMIAGLESAVSSMPEAEAAARDQLSRDLNERISAALAKAEESLTTWIAGHKEETAEFQNDTADLFRVLEAELQTFREEAADKFHASAATQERLERVRGTLYELSDHVDEVVEAHSQDRAELRARVEEIGRSLGQISALFDSVKELREFSAAQDNQVDTLYELMEEVTRSVTEAGKAAEKNTQDVQELAEKLVAWAAAAADGRTELSQVRAKLSEMGSTDKALADSLAEFIEEMGQKASDLQVNLADQAATSRENYDETVRVLEEQAQSIEQDRIGMSARLEEATAHYAEIIAAAKINQDQALKSFTGRLQGFQEDQEERHADVLKTVADNLNRWPEVRAWARGGPPYRQHAIVEWRKGIWQAVEDTDEEPSTGSTWRLLVDGVFHMEFQALDLTTGTTHLKAEMSSGEVVEQAIPSHLMRVKGTWQKSAQYVFNDSVIENGSRWVCTVARAKIGVPPSKSDEWALVALRGPAGKRGPAGREGSPPAIEEILKAWQDYREVDGVIPIGGYRGPWKYGAVYSRTDVASFGDGLYLATADHEARETPQQSLDNWTILILAEGGGGGGGGGGTGSGGHIIQDGGVEAPQQPVLNFTGSGVAVEDDPANGATKVIIPGGGSGGLVNWEDIVGKPTEFPPEPHDADHDPHNDARYAPIAHSTGALDGAAGHVSAQNRTQWDAAYGWGNHADAGYLTTVSWGDVTGKPATFPPSAHDHIWDDITDPPAEYPPSAHTHDPFAGAGSTGFVPDPLTESARFLMDDGTWANAPVSPVGGGSLDYKWDSDTTATAPASGDIKVNNATHNLATEIYVSDETNKGNDASFIWSSRHVGEYVGLWEDTGDHESIYYKFTSEPVDNGGWFTIGIAAIPGSMGGMENNRNMSVFLIDNPLNKLPPGGAVGEVLTKVSSTDFDADWEAPVTGTRGEWTPSNGQDEFTIQYEVGYLDVFVNGAKLANADFTATNGSSFTLNAAVTDQDLVAAIAWAKGAISGIEEYADDSAAATGGVPIGGLYHTAGAAKVRIA